MDEDPRPVPGSHHRWQAIPLGLRLERRRPRAAPFFQPAVSPVTLVPHPASRRPVGHRRVHRCPRAVPRGQCRAVRTRVHHPTRAGGQPRVRPTRRAAVAVGHAPGSPTTGRLPLHALADLPLTICSLAQRENDRVATALRDVGVEPRLIASMPNRQAQLTLVLGGGVHAFLPLRMAVQARRLGAVVIETTCTIQSGRSF